MRNCAARKPLRDKVLRCILNRCADPCAGSLLSCLPCSPYCAHLKHAEERKAEIACAFVRERAFSISRELLISTVLYPTFLSSASAISEIQAAQSCANRPKFRGSCAPKRWTEMTAKMEVTRKRMMRVDDTGTSAAVLE